MGVWAKNTCYQLLASTCPSQRAWAAALYLLPWLLYRSRPLRVCQLRGHRVHFDLTMAQQQGRCPVAVAYLALEHVRSCSTFLVCYEPEGHKPRPEGRWVFSIIVSAVRLKPVLSISCTTIGVCMPVYLLSSWPLCRPDRQSFRGTSFPKAFFARLLSLIPLCEVHERFSLRLHSFRLKPACMSFGYVFLCFAGCITLHPYRTVQG